MKKFKDLKFKEIDPTGVVVNEHSFTFETHTVDENGETGMKVSRFLLTIGDNEYLINHKGELIEKV